MRTNPDACDINKKALSDLLIESAGSFPTSGVYSEAPLPDLVLEGFGPIPLPLAERDADALCKKPTKGDEGKGSTEVRCTTVVAEE